MFGFVCKKASSENENGLTKKQQAIADREVELIELAKTIVQKEGFIYLTMDKLTAASLIRKVLSTIISVVKKMWLSHCVI